MTDRLARDPGRSPCAENLPFSADCTTSSHSIIAALTLRLLDLHLVPRFESDHPMPGIRAELEAAENFDYALCGEDDYFFATTFTPPLTFDASM